jgi:HSP20 family protein
MEEKSYDPFEELQKEYKKFLDHLVSTGWGSTRFADSPWMPMLNICENSTHYMLHVELPGLDKENIRLVVQGDMLTIQGKKELKHSLQPRRCFHMEIHTGPFYRAIQLPAAVDAAQVEAKYEQGILEVLIKKSPPTSGKKIIEIHTEE